MIVVALDAGASKAGLAVLRVTQESRGTRFVCIRHGHLDLMLDGDDAEERAVSAILGVADWAAAQRDGEERLVFAVEGIEGHVYPGRSTTHLFDTADQAGGIRLCLRAWARLRGVQLGARDVRKTTARAVRRFIFGKGGDSVGDNEVVIAVRASVAGMPTMSVPVPDSRSEAYKPMHAYDAAAVAIVAAAEAMRWTRIGLPAAAMEEVARYRIAAGLKKEADKALIASGLKKARKPREDSRSTRRRRSEAAKLTAARRAP